MDIKQATEEYEAWLGKRLTLVPADLELKHQRMAESPFPFLRATFYRWVQRWPEVCPELATAPAVLSVGDLHVENFGTWRDAEGRLIWGINDFDEAFRCRTRTIWCGWPPARPGDSREPAVLDRSQRRLRRDPGGLQEALTKAEAHSCWPRGIPGCGMRRRATA